MVDLQELSSDLPGQVRADTLDQREETLAQHGGSEQLLALDEDGLLSLRRQLVGAGSHPEPGKHASTASSSISYS